MFREVCSYVGLSLTGDRLFRHSTRKAASFYVSNAAPVQDVGNGPPKAPCTLQSVRLYVAFRPCLLPVTIFIITHFLFQYLLMP